MISKYVSYHNDMYFFDILTTKNDPDLIYFIYILTWKYILCHNGLYFFDILTSKSGFL